MYKPVIIKIAQKKLHVWEEWPIGEKAGYIIAIAKQFDGFGLRQKDISIAVMLAEGDTLFTKPIYKSVINFWLLSRER